MSETMILVCGRCIIIVHFVDHPAFLFTGDETVSIALVIVVVEHCGGVDKVIFMGHLKLNLAG